MNVAVVGQEPRYKALLIVPLVPLAKGPVKPIPVMFKGAFPVLLIVTTFWPAAVVGLVAPKLVAGNVIEPGNTLATGTSAAMLDQFELAVTLS